MRSRPGFFHVGVTVASIDRSLPFWVEGLGLNLQSDRVASGPQLATLTGLPVTALRIALLEMGGGVVELLEYHGVESAQVDHRPSDQGSGHVCLFVEDLDALIPELVRLGGTLVSSGVIEVGGGEYAGCRCVYVRAPDGFLVELFTTPVGRTAL